MALKTHLEVQQRENICRDLAEIMKFVPLDFRVGESVFCGQKDPSKIQQGRKSGKWWKVEIIVVESPMAVISSGASIFQVNASRLKSLLNIVDLEKLLDPRERTGALVLCFFAQVNQISGSCFLTTLIKVLSLIGKESWLQPQ